MSSGQVNMKMKVECQAGQVNTSASSLNLPVVSTPSTLLQECGVPSNRHYSRRFSFITSLCFKIVPIFPPAQLQKCFLLISASAHSLQVSTRVWRKEAKSTCSPVKKAEVQRGKQDKRPVSTHYGVRGRQAWQVCKWHGGFEQGISHRFWFSLALTF